LYIVLLRSVPLRLGGDDLFTKHANAEASLSA